MPFLGDVEKSMLLETSKKFLNSKGLTPWIFAQKWGRQKMSLEKTYFALWMYTKAGEKEFFKSYIGLSSCHLTSTGQPAHSAGINSGV